MAEIPRLDQTRPLSPHMQIWRWHVTMAASILHRVTGVALWVGLLILVAWLYALAAGPVAFSAVAGALASLPGLAILFMVTLSLFFHLANGIRHLAWDLGFGFQLKTADATAWGAGLFALAANLGFWAWIVTAVRAAS
jgi:succinate dehydrogenase / fumarate reductase cytochrome b subunit